MVCEWLKVEGGETRVLDGGDWVDPGTLVERLKFRQAYNRKAGVEVRYYLNLTICVNNHAEESLRARRKMCKKCSGAWLYRVKEGVLSEIIMKTKENHILRGHSWAEQIHDITRIRRYWRFTREEVWNRLGVSGSVERKIKSRELQLVMQSLGFRVMSVRDSKGRVVKGYGRG
jgi:hypothetical protein